MRLSIIEGAITTVYLAWTTNIVLAGYMIHLGAANWQVSLAGSIQMLALVSSVLAIPLERTLTTRKRATVILCALGRGGWILSAVLPFLALPPQTAAMLALVLLTACSLMQSVGAALWMAWIGDVVPDTLRGRYFGFRIPLLGLVGLLANLAAGYYLDSLAEDSRGAGFSLLYVIAAFCALIGMALLARHHEPPPTINRQPLREALAVPWQDKDFRRLLLFAAYWRFSVFLAGPVVWPYFINHLKMSFTQNAIYYALASGIAMIAGPMWGAISDRVGKKPVLAITTVLTGTAMPLCWMLATPGEPAWAYVGGFIEAFAWGGIDTVFFTLSLSNAPREQRVAYYSVLSAVSGLTGFIGGALSGPLLELFKPVTFTMGTYLWTEYHTVILISGIARSQAFRLLRRVKEPGAWRTSQLLKSMFTLRIGAIVRER